jgi:hypothetical protein
MPRASWKGIPRLSLGVLPDLSFAGNHAHEVNPLAPGLGSNSGGAATREKRAKAPPDRRQATSPLPLSGVRKRKERPGAEPLPSQGDASRPMGAEWLARFGMVVYHLI